MNKHFLNAREPFSGGWVLQNVYIYTRLDQLRMKPVFLSLLLALVMLTGQAQFTADYQFTLENAITIDESFQLGPTTFREEANNVTYECAYAIDYYLDYEEGVEIYTWNWEDIRQIRVDTTAGKVVLSASSELILFSLDGISSYPRSSVTLYTRELLDVVQFNLLGQDILKRVNSAGGNAELIIR